jgi:hypothetical protein
MLNSEAGACGYGKQENVTKGQFMVIIKEFCGCY